MNPYYQDDAVTIYHGDCREILPTLTFDVIVTDPPYGINHDTDHTRFKGTADFNKTHGKWTGKQHAPVHGDDEAFQPEWLIDGRPIVLFGPNHYAQRLPDGGTWHVWDKREELGSNMLADLEMWWTSYPSGPSRIYRYKWLGYMRAGEVGVHLHPTQKPLALMRHIMGDRMPPGVIVDPYMGSGTTLRAAKDLSRHAIGIELDERYCEIAATRMAQEVLDFGPAA